MSTAQVLLAVGAPTLLVGVIVLVLGIRSLVRNARVLRVRVPARLLRRVWVGPGELVDVEYPAPDGSTLRTEMYVNFVRAPGLPAGYDGTVWVDPAHPTDVTPRRTGRNAWGLTGTIVGTVLLLGGGVVTLIGAVLPG